MQSKALDALTAAQREAAGYLDGPALVVAGPGSGKTRTLVARLTALIESGTACADELLAVTFTRKAAGELRSRLTAALGAAGQGVTVGTFHQVALLLRPLPTGTTLLSEGDRVLFCEQALEDVAARSTRPPASLDPGRSRAWLEVRRAEVERMSAVYERASPAGASGRDAAAAIVETRKAQVYESDLALLEEVAAAVETAGDAALAAQMRELAAVRREAVFVGYGRCLEAIAAWGHDPAGQAALCRAGLGRLVGRYEEPIEYAPDADGRIVAAGRAAKERDQRP